MAECSELIECAICNEFLLDPWALPCGPSYCGPPRACVSSMEMREEMLKCAICRVDHNLKAEDIKPPGGISEYIENGSQLKTSERTLLPCSLHENNNCLFWCNNCEIMMCDDCFDGHDGHLVKELKNYLVEKIETELGMSLVETFMKYQESAKKLIDAKTSNLETSRSVVSDMEKEFDSILQQRELIDQFCELRNSEDTNKISKETALLLKISESDVKKLKIWEWRNSLERRRASKVNDKSLVSVSTQVEDLNIQEFGDLRAVIDSQDKIIKKLRKQVKSASSAGVAGSTGNFSDDEIGSRKSGDTPGGSLLAGRSASFSNNAASAVAQSSAYNRQSSVFTGGSAQAVVTYQGMLAYSKADEPALIRNLVIELKPIVAATMTPCLPSYVLLMCIRHGDYLNDELRVASLLHNSINGIKKVIKKRRDNAEYVTLWLSNSVSLLHLLKQYSGEEKYSKNNTDAQNQQCLRKFDLTEYRTIINDFAIQIYQNLVRILDNKLQPMIVSGMLENEGLNKATSMMPSSSNQAGASSANSAEESSMMGGGGGSNKKSQYTLNTILKQLSVFLNVFSRHSLDFDVVKQLFKQLMYIVVSATVNNLLLRREMCHSFKGTQIRYNLSELEEWLRNHRLAECGTLEQLAVVVEIAQLLQVGKKTDADADNVADMCSKLTPQEILKVLNLYTPINDSEDKVSVEFIKKVEERLKSKAEQGLVISSTNLSSNGRSSLLMDSRHLYPVTFPYHPSEVSLPSVTIPETLPLRFLKRV